MKLINKINFISIYIKNSKKKLLHEYQKYQNIKND